MRICLIASSQFPIREPFAGGLEAHTHALARCLTERGHQVTLFAAAGSDPQLRAEELVPEKLHLSELARHDVGASPDEWMQQHHAYLGLMLRLHRSGGQEFDVVHNNSIHHLPVALSGLVSVPLLTTLHTPPTPWLESAIQYRGAFAHFNAVSQAMAHAWGHVLDPQVVLNGIDTGLWASGPGGTDAVWMGRMVPEKAPHLAIDAARSAGYRITLAGPLLDRQYFETMVAPRLGADALYQGHLPQSELVKLVGSSAVAVVSSQWDEPYGLVAAEAMACGTPVASFARGGLTEIITPDSGVLAEPESVTALTQAIHEAARLNRAEVRRRAETALSLERMVTDYEKVYERLLTPVVQP